MTLYTLRSIFHLVRLLYVSPQTFGPYYVRPSFHPYIPEVDSLFTKTLNRVVELVRQGSQKWGTIQSIK
jgi:hypothetical protein